MTAHCRAWIASLALLGGCAGVHITPTSVRETPGTERDAEAALTAWREAVDLANEFLASPYRVSLPAGIFEFDDSGMRFAIPKGYWPIEVWWTPWGNLVLWTGGGAQEASYGFVVGLREVPGRKSIPVLDNSFFRSKGGELRRAEDMARMILHETTHVVYDVGTVGFGSSLSYYLELIFLLRSSTNSAERRPRATSEEFTYFTLAKGASDENLRALTEKIFREHLEKGGDNCEHGPFTDHEPPPQARTSP